MSLELSIGEEAPDFTLPASNGEKLTLSLLKGKNVILYFYPKDNTSGCTAEACDFRDHSEGFATTETVIIGISKDKLSSHNKFIEKYQLPFLLLSDEDTSVAMLYGVWQEKNMYGKKSMGMVRTTFVIDKKGRIAKIFPKVKVKGHVQAVLKYVEEEMNA